MVSDGPEQGKGFEGQVQGKGFEKDSFPAAIVRVQKDLPMPLPLLQKSELGLTPFLESSHAAKTTWFYELCQDNLIWTF